MAKLFVDHHLTAADTPATLAAMGVKLVSKTGTLVEVTWLDAAGYIGEELSSAVPVKCKTVGWLMDTNRLSLVLASSLYEDATGDFTVIPTGMVVKCREIEAYEDEG